jgi:HD-like signal output (HDOD) protein
VHTLAATVEQRAAAPDVATLIADLRQLPAHRPALLRVVQLADDPDVSLGRLAQAAALDPAFAARLLQLANSAVYGRRGRVSALGPAVGVLGAETVRGLAVSMALGLAGEHGPLPAGFWDRAACNAASSRLLAPVVGADGGDAFCAGLLREVGQALLFRAAPAEYARLLAAGDAAGLGEAERAWCGATSDEVAAAALQAAGLPDALSEAIAHQGAAPAAAAGDEPPLARALRAGLLLARAVEGGEVEPETVAALEAVLGRRYDEDAVRALALRVAAQAAALSTSMR